MALVCHTQLYDLVVSGKSPWPRGLLFSITGHERLGLSQPVFLESLGNWAWTNARWWSYLEDLPLRPLVKCGDQWTCLGLGFPFTPTVTVMDAGV